MIHFEESDESRTSGVRAAGLAPHPGWEAALAAALAAMRARKLVLLVGAPGTGKSLLLARLCAVLSAEGARVAHLRHAGVNDRPEADILLVDEADKRPPAELAELRGAGACVLAGLPSLREAVRDAVPAPEVILLGPLAAQDVGAFVCAVLRGGAGRNLAVDDEAVEAFAAASGVPRNLHILAGLAGFGAELEGRGRIEARHVRAAAAMRHGLDETLEDAPEQPAALRDLDQPPAAAPTSLDAGRPVEPKPARPRSRRLLVAAAAGSVAIAAAAFVIVRPSPAPEIAAPSQLASSTAQQDVAEQPAAAEPPPPEAPAAAEQAPPADASPPPVVVAPPAMPSLAAPRVVLTYPSNDPAAARSAQAAADRLAGLGWAVERPHARAFPAAGGVTFFFAEDAARAAAVADALGGAVRPAPARLAQASPGTIEVALPVGP